MALNQLEFAGEVLTMGDVPKTTVRWRKFIEFLQLEREVGGLIPVGMAAELLGVSERRVQQLVEEGTLRSYRLPGHRQHMLGARELVAFSKLERSRGRPVGDVPIKVDFREEMESMDRYFNGDD